MFLSKYFEISNGNIPIIFSCPHGGYKTPKNVPDKTEGYKIPDVNTFFIAKQIINLLRRDNLEIYYILNKVHRSKIDLNRPPHSSSAFNHSSIEAQNIYHAFHEQLANFSQECIIKFKKALILDFHGFTKPHMDYPDVILGHVFGKTLDITFESEKDNCEKYWGCFQLFNILSKSFKVDDGLATSDFNLAYSGGYITHKYYNSARVNAIQIEVAKYIRLDYSLTLIFINCIVNAVKESIHDLNLVL
jgi:N-formylglutamate amidohydrolase